MYKRTESPLVSLVFCEGNVGFVHNVNIDFSRGQDKIHDVLSAPL